MLWFPVGPYAYLIDRRARQSLTTESCVRKLVVIEDNNAYRPVSGSQHALTKLSILRIVRIVTSIFHELTLPHIIYYLSYGLQ